MNCIYLFKEIGMLAEIFFLRLEAMRREAEFEEAVRPGKARFVPFSPGTFTHLRERRAGEMARHA
jgi:hypothetical protein